MNDPIDSILKKIRDQQMNEASLDHFMMNQLHDALMQKIIEGAYKKISEQYGPSPSPFSFFLMGSAGRFEQAIWSDQDHGIVYYNSSEDAKNYFLVLGNEISEGLKLAGYKYCDGGVMASNPLWCKSFSEWEEQLTSWLTEASWQSIRNLLIFIDSRSLYGETEYILQLKKLSYDSIHKQQLFKRLIDNTMNLKKGVSVFGQLLVETHGPYTGLLNVKEKAFFPYINAARLLAIMEKSASTSTLSRLGNWPIFEQQYLKLLDFRLRFGRHIHYESGHYIYVDSLQHEQKKELKEILKYGVLLFQTVRKIVEKD